MNSLLLAVSTAIFAQPLPSEAVLEPSVQNEVEHALQRAPSPLPRLTAAAEAYGRRWQTDGLGATKTAIALVSAQRADGRWLDGTNDVTAAAVMTLRRIGGPSVAKNAFPAGGVALEGDYSGHLQDIWYPGGDVIWWAHTHALLKTDLTGRVLVKRDVVGHHAGCEVRDGKLYVAVCPYQRKGQRLSMPEDRLQVNVYDAASLEPCGEHVLTNVADRAGSLAILPDGTLVVGCLRPPDIAVDQVRLHHISADFKLIRSYVIDGVLVPLGIETIKYHDGELFLCCYAKGGLTIVLDAQTFREKRRLTGFNGAVGFAFVDGGVVFGRTRKPDGKRWRSSLGLSDLPMRRFFE